jgi:hypothetical protein
MLRQIRKHIYRFLDSVYFFQQTPPLSVIIKQIEVPGFKRALPVSFF